MLWHDVKHNSDEWFAARAGRVTASCAGKFMANDGKAFGEPARKYALQIAIERITGMPCGDGYTNEYMERGHVQEPIARMKYEDSEFVDVTPGGFFDCGRYGASPDGLVGLDGMIEIKCVAPHIHASNIDRGGPDPSYWWQLLSHLDCSGRSWVDFVSYCEQFPAHRQIVTYRIHAGDVADEIGSLQARRTKFIELIDKNVTKYS